MQQRRRRLYRPHHHHRRSRQYVRLGRGDWRRGADRAIVSVLFIVPEEEQPQAG